MDLQRKVSMEGAIFVFLSAVGFSAKAILVKLAYGYGVDSVTLLALRMFFSLPFFLALFYWTGRGGMDKRQWISAVFLGLLGYYLSSFLDFSGLMFISAGLERMVLMLYPTMVVLLSALFFKKKITKRQIHALSLCYAGIILVFMHDASFNSRGIFMGSILVFLSGFSFALYLIGSGEMIAKVGALRFTAVAMTVASLASMAQFFVLRPTESLRLPLEVYGLSIAMALFSTVLPSILLSEGMKRIGAAKASMINSAGPVMTIFLASWVLNEPVSILQMAGSALVLSGVLLISKK